MKLNTLFPLLCAALAGGFAPVAFGQSATTYYLDVSGTSPGFGNPDGQTIDWTATDWSTDPTGVAAPGALPNWYSGGNFYPSQLIFGYPGTTGISNSTFTVTANGPMIAGVVFNAPCSVTLQTFNVFNFLAPETWSVPTGSTFSIAQEYANWSFTTTTLYGGGTVNFNCNDVGRNAGTFIQSMTNGTVNLTDAYVDSGVAQASYQLLAGTLNFATANSASAIGGAAPAGTQVFNLAGGAVDNTSGSAMTLSLGNVNFQIGGSFAFVGSSSLDFGATPANLGTVTPTIAVSNNTLEFDGPLTNSAGLTVAGGGTLLLTAVNTYSGNTTISSGTLALSGSGSIASSPQISIASGATFDVSATGGWSGSGSQTLSDAGTSGTGTVNAGVRNVTLTSGDSLLFQAAGGGSPSAGKINVAGASGALYLNNNTVTINVSGSQLGASTNILLTVQGSLNGTANSAPIFTGPGLVTGCGARIVTTSGSSGSLALIVTNTPHGTQTSTTSVSRTTGASSGTYGGQLTFKATVTGTTTSPTGNVIFKDGANTLATMTLTTGTSPTSTAAYTEYTTLNVAGSPHSIVAYYQGDSTYTTSDSSANPVAQTITPKPLTYSGLTVATNAYDATTVAALGGTPAFLAPEISGTGSINDDAPYNVDAVTAGGAAIGVLAAKNVGTQLVTVTGVTVTGTGAANYSVVQQTGLVETVIPKNLTVTGLSINITNPPALIGTAGLPASETASPTSGGDGAPYTGEFVSLTGTPVGTYATNSAPFNLVVNVTGLSLTGANAGNYSLIQPLVLNGPTANGTAYYIDVNGANPGTGFGDPSGTIDWTDGDWTTDPTANSATESLPPLYDPNTFAYNPLQLTFGSPGTTGVSNDTFTVTSYQDIAGVVFYAPCTCTLQTFGIFSFGPPQAWSVPTGSTFNIAQNYANWAFTSVLMLGGGTINFDCNDVGRNAGNFIQDMPGGTVNLTDAYLDSGTAQANYQLLNGTLNFSTANSAAALGGPGGGRYLNISGGTVDNTSGSTLTLNLGAANCQIDGNFAFAGSSSLNFGGNTVNLGAVTPTITVSNNTLEFDGSVTGTAGLTKAGAGTLLLTAANTYSGNTTVTGGILEIAQATLATNSTITVASGATLQMDYAGTATVNNLVLNGTNQPAGVYSAATSSPYLAGTGSLKVLGIVTPAPITATVASGNRLVLNWPAGQGWLLQSNSVSLINPNGWITITGATPPYTNSINKSSPAVFYRLKH